MRKRNFEYYCDNFENIENYEQAKANNFKGWLCHHRLETHNSDGERRLVDITDEELIALDMYFHRPANELIFMTRSEHSLLHQKGKKFSEERKINISKAHKGKPKSEETRRKMGEAKKCKHWKVVDDKRVWH